MIRCLRLILGLSLILLCRGAMPAPSGVMAAGDGAVGEGVRDRRECRLQGAGHYAMGAGMYNLDTAQARSINAQTAMQWNDYVAQVTHESARIHAARVHNEFAEEPEALRRLSAAAPG